MGALHRTIANSKIVLEESIADAEGLRIATRAKKFAPLDEVDLTVFFR
jgi:hypothetical protein